MKTHQFLTSAIMGVALMGSGAGVSQASTVIFGVPQGLEESIAITNFNDGNLLDSADDNNQFNIRIDNLRALGGGNGTMELNNATAYKVKAYGTADFYYSPPGTVPPGFDPNNPGPDVASFTFTGETIFRGAFGADFGLNAGTVSFGPNVVPNLVVGPTGQMDITAVGVSFLPQILAQLLNLPASPPYPQNDNPLSIVITAIGATAGGSSLTATVTENGCNPAVVGGGCLLIDTLRFMDANIGRFNGTIDGVLKVRPGFELVVPEPSSLALVIAGLAAFAFGRGKKLA